MKAGLFPFYPQKIVLKNKIYDIMVLARKIQCPTLYGENKKPSFESGWFFILQNR